MCFSGKDALGLYYLIYHMDVACKYFAQAYPMLADCILDTKPLLDITEEDAAISVIGEFDRYELAVEGDLIQF